MGPQWQAPQDWQKDGSTISGITSLKTGAWTSMLAAKETKDGREIEVVIKTFSVPADVLEDPERIAKEREKFIASARLQKALSDDPQAKAWIDILRISEDPANTSFSMKKCGPSLQDFLERKVFLSAHDLHLVTLCILQGFAELFEKHKRSHGSLKASDVLQALPGAAAYLLSDPAPKGEDHSANDLYALGTILYQLIEHREWDPLTPIIPTKNWARFGSQRDRWIQFLNMLLSPNGCHESLVLVRKEALRVRPASGTRNALLAAASLLVLAGAGLAIWHFMPVPKKSVPAPIAVTPTIDPAVKADWDKAHQAYQDIFTTWTKRDRTQRYDHTQSVALAQASRNFIQDIALTETEAYRTAAKGYRDAAAKLKEALDQCATEEKAGLALDQDALAEFQKAQKDFADAKGAWDTAAVKFSAKHDHAKSTALAQATQSPSSVAPADAPGRHAAADQFRAAGKRYGDALTMARQEELVGQSVEQAQAGYQDARTKYLAARDKWETGSVGLTFDISAAKALADQAKATIPDQVVLTDPASYQKAGDQYASANAKLDQALKLLDDARQANHAKETDVSTAVARGNEALQAKDYAVALAWYRKAADLGNAAAMGNVGLLYETGRGIEKDEAEAARWYRKAADLNIPAAMVSLALLHEKGLGVPKDYGEAIGLYKKAAALNDPAAMRNLAYLYDNGLGVEKNPAEALRWDQKAAALNDGSAAFLVGLHYEQGKGVPIDYGQAMTWYQKASDLNYARAMNAIGVLYETGHGTKQDPAQAMVWYKKAAALNFPPAMSNVGAMYDNGIGVTLDHAEALKWFRKGADLGHGMSMYNLAVLYETGRGTATDLGQALDWYRKAARSDDEQAKSQAISRLDALGFSR